MGLAGRGTRSVYLLFNEPDSPPFIDGFGLLNRSIALETMEQYVQTGGDMHSRWAGVGIECIYNAKYGLQRARGNASLER